jgi:hypothetical protein
MNEQRDGAVDELTETEREALHALQLGVEHVDRAYGQLLGFHHHVGRGMDRLAAAEDLLRAAGHEAFADHLRDELLPSGVVGERWSYELVEAFADGMQADVHEFDSDLRDALVGGRRHVVERAQRDEWRERARGWPPD